MYRIADLDLLMVGKTGNGKSALGNAILKRDVFKSDSSCQSVTKDIASDFSDYKGRVIKVVDGPGVGDTRMDSQKAVELVVEAMAGAIAANPRGYHAFLLVVCFGGRFTDEDIQTVNFLKNIFGEEFVRRFCILVFTYGDLFETQNRKSKSKQTFDQWCQKQEGVISQLLKECDNRYVLFDNMTEDESKQDAQIDRLLDLVDGLQSQGNRYNDINFQKAQKKRDWALAASKEVGLRDEIMQETSLITQEMEKIKTKYEGEEQISHLKELETRCDKLLKYLKEQDNNTGAFKQLIDTVTGSAQAVSGMIQAQTQMAEQKKEHEESQKALKADLQEEIKKKDDKMKKQLKKQQEDYDKRMKEMKDAYQREMQRANRGFFAKFCDTVGTLVGEVMAVPYRIGRSVVNTLHDV